VELGEATNDAGVLKEAVEHYRTGLALDDARPDWEVIRRFSESRRMEIEAQLDLATSVAPVSYR